MDPRDIRLRLENPSLEDEVFKCVEEVEEVFNSKVVIGGSLLSLGIVNVNIGDVWISRQGHKLKREAIILVFVSTKQR